MRKKSLLRDIRQFFKKNNFVYLFVSLSVLLFVSSLILEIPGEKRSVLFTLVTMLMIVVSIQSVQHEINWKRIVYGLSIIFAVLAALSNIMDSEVYVLLLLMVLLVFFVGMFFAIAGNVLFKGDIDNNKIIGSLSLYMLLGLAWAVIYLILLSFDPKAISGIEAGQWHEAFASVAYFSFVTLTTLGYGDMLPQSPVTRFFVYMEAIIGVFYMAIVVSSLITLRLDAIQKEKEKREKEEIKEAVEEEKGKESR